MEASARGLQNNIDYSVFATLLGIFIGVLIATVRSTYDKNLESMQKRGGAGFAVFTVIVVRAGMVYDSIFLSVFVGMLTGVGGGVLRDLFVNEKPYIFVKHFYACASISGALVAALCWSLGEIPAMAIGAVVVFILRILAARFHWSLPKIKA